MGGGVVGGVEIAYCGVVHVVVVVVEIVVVRVVVVGGGIDSDITVVGQMVGLIAVVVEYCVVFGDGWYCRWFDRCHNYGVE